MACLKFVGVVLLSLCAYALADVDSRLGSAHQASSEKVLASFADAIGSCQKESEVNLHNDTEVVCAAVPEINQCLLRKEATWNETHSGAYTKVFLIYRELGKTSMDRLCENGGKKLSKLKTAHDHFINSSSGHSDEKVAFMAECIYLGSMPLPIVDGSKAIAPYKVWYLFYHIPNYFECFDKYMYLNEPYIELLRELAADTLEIMKCLRPEDEEIVPCKEVNMTVADKQHMCPLKEKHSVENVSKHLVNASNKCFEERHYGPDISYAASLKQMEKYFMDYCTPSSAMFIRCNIETKIEADLCLSDSKLEEFKLVRFYKKLLRDTGCVDNGKGLATLFHRFQVVNNSTGEATTNMTDCLVGTLMGDSESLDVNGYYNELPAIRQCLLDMMSGDTAFETVLDGMYRTIRDGMKCLDPENREVVLCKSLYHLN